MDPRLLKQVNRELDEIRNGLARMCVAAYLAALLVLAWLWWK